MAGHDHAPSETAEERSPELQAQHARLGLRLFAIYCVLYATFMGLVTFGLSRLAASEVFGIRLGINLALAYGLGLIATAILLAFLYGWLCRRTASDVREAGR